jgi:hypothetical protein
VPVPPNDVSSAPFAVSLIKRNVDPPPSPLKTTVILPSGETIRLGASAAVGCWNPRSTTPVPLNDKSRSPGEAAAVPATIIETTAIRASQAHLRLSRALVELVLDTGSSFLIPSLAISQSMFAMIPAARMHFNRFAAHKSSPNGDSRDARNDWRSPVI